VPIIADKNNHQCPANGTNPISTAFGNKLQSETDFSLPGSFGIRFDRYYSSAHDPYSKQALWKPTSLGEQWRSSFDRRIDFVQTPSVSTAYVVRPDGDRFYFNQVGTTSSFVADPDVTYSLTGSPSYGWSLTTPEDDVEVYDTDGKIIALTNRDGRSLYYYYNTQNQLVSVQDDKERVVTLSYQSYDPTALCEVQPTAGLLKSITLPDGSQYQYGYSVVTSGLVCPDPSDAKAYLTSVTYPDPSGNKTRTYVYGEGTSRSQHWLTGIVDENQSRFATWQYDTSGRAWLSVHGDVNSTTDRVELVFNGDINSDPTATTTTKLWVDSANNKIAQRTYSFDTKLGVVRMATLDVPCDGCGGGKASANTYDAAGYRVSSTDFNGKVTKTQYDETLGVEVRRDEGIADPNSSQFTRRTETDWNFAGLHVPTERRIFSSSGAKESQTDWVYNDRGQALARCEIDPTDSSGYACSNSIAPPIGSKVRRWTYTYCEDGDGLKYCPIAGLLFSVDGPRTDVADTTAYLYYGATDESGCATSGGTCHHIGDIWKVLKAGQISVIYISYDKNGRPTRTQDANGVYTDMTYHPRGWLLTRTVRANSNGTPNASLDATTKFDYDSVGNVTKVTQPDQSFVSYTYDGAHRLTDVADILNNKIHYTLDDVGNRKDEKTYDPNGSLQRELTRQYNQLNHLTAILNSASATVMSYSNPSDSPPQGVTYTDGYDGNGNAIYSLDGASTPVGTYRTFDPLNRLATILQDHAGSGATHDTATQYTYDARDNLRSVMDPDHLVTNYTYDGLNNLSSLDSPDTGHADYTYDAAGNRKTLKDARLRVTNYSYDSLNRLVGITYPTSSLNVTYAYDQTAAGCYNIGRLTSITDSSGSTVYCYDQRGNVLRKTQNTKIYSNNNGTVGSTIYSLVTSYTYTLADQLSSITYPSNDVITFDRDAAGRVKTVKWGSTNIINSISYYPFGPLSTITFANGRSLTKTYDRDYVIDQVTSSSSTGLTIDAGVDAMGNLKSASSSVGASPVTAQYVYDPLYRLTDVQDGTGGSLESFTYYPTGDRHTVTRQGAGTQTYAYAPATHRLSDVAGVARAYDSNGNLTLLNSRTATYDDRNRLAGWGLNASGGIDVGTIATTYNYNGRGERVVKEDGTTSPASITPTAYTYNEGGQLLGEYKVTVSGSPSGVVTVQSSTNYVYVDGTPVAALVKGATGAPTLYYVETDQLNTPRQVILPGATTASDTPVWKWDYFANNSAFGENAPSLASVTFNLRFPGQYFDAETGLNYNYFRDYESSTGRYSESDPIGLGGGPNTYAYAANSPLIYVDPSGTLHWTGKVVWSKVTFGVPKLDKLSLGYHERASLSLKSECRNGHCYKVGLHASNWKFGLGYGGFDVSELIGDVELDDPSEEFSDQSAARLTGLMRLSTPGGVGGANGHIRAGDGRGHFSAYGVHVPSVDFQGDGELEAFSRTPELCDGCR